MRPRRLYASGGILIVAGLAIAALTPTTWTSSTCSCPAALNGQTCPCPDPNGALCFEVVDSFLIAGIVAIAVAAVLHLRELGRKRGAPPRHTDAW